MSRHAKVQYICPSVNVRRTVRWIYESWRLALEKVGRKDSTWMASSLRSDTQRVEKLSLAGTICLWVEELGVEEAVKVWEALLKRVPTSEFLKKGYRNLNPPNLAWLFSYSSNGRGHDRVLEGVYDNWHGARYYSEEGV